MIHISNSKASPSLTSTMCSRRNRGMLQTSIILVLFCCIGYGFYLYNLLQVKIKYLDSKAVHHQSKQQALSSQLQVVYEDRSRLEKAMQNSKMDLQKAKEEFDQHRKEKEEMIQQMLIEHQDKHHALQDENVELKEKIKTHEKERSKLERDRKVISAEHERLKQEHQEMADSYASNVKEIRESNDRYRLENNHIRQNQQNLEEQVRQAKDGQAKYENLRYVLKALPADVVNLRHPAITNLGPNGKQILLDHLGDDPGARQFQDDGRGQPDGQQDEQRRRDYEHVQRQLNPQGGNGGGDARQDLNYQDNYQDGRQNGDEEHGDQMQHQRIGEGQDSMQLPVQPNVQMRDVDICALPAEAGPCRESITRFYYNYGVNDCRAFTFGGCGGNENNFQTWEVCQRICNDPEKRIVHQPVSEEEQVRAMYGQIGHHEEPEKQPQEHLQGDPIGDEHYNAGENLDAQEVHQVYPDTQHNQEDDDNNMGGGDEDEQQKITSEEEERARQQEELARKELMDAQNRDENHEQMDQGDDPLAKLQKLSEEQMKVAKDQEDSMRKLLEQQQQNYRGHNPTDDNQIEARIVDERNVDPGGDEDEEYTQEDGGTEEEDNREEANVGGKQKDEDDVQVAVPPAAQVAGQDPEAVMNRPPPAGQPMDGQDEVYNEKDHDTNLDNPMAQNENDDPLFERGGARDPGGDYLDERQEEDDDVGEEEDFNQDGDRDRYQDGGREDDFDQGIQRANFVQANKDEAENNNEEDDGYEEEDDQAEEEGRAERDKMRMQNDKHFGAMQQMEEVMPQQGVHFERDDRDI